jgi:hypothetical protein
MLWYQETHADPKITFDGHLEYPITTLTLGSKRLQIIPVDGAWTSVILDVAGYRQMLEEEITPEILASIEWAYGEIAPPSDVLELDPEARP